MQTERVQANQSKKEAQLTRIVDEYKAGGKRVIDAQGIERVYIDGQQITGAELARANAMREESAFLAAETQGATSAKYVQQSYVSEVMNEQQTQGESPYQHAPHYSGRHRRERKDSCAS